MLQNQGFIQVTFLSVEAGDETSWSSINPNTSKALLPESTVVTEAPKQFFKGKKI